MHDPVTLRYGSSLEHINSVLTLRTSSGEPLELKQTEKKGVLYFECPDFLTGEAGAYPYMDHILNYSDLEVGEDLGGGITVRELGLTKAVLSLTQNLDEWVKSISVPNTIKNGARYDSVEKCWTSYTVKGFEDFRNLLTSFTDLFATKERQFNLDIGCTLQSACLEYLALQTHGISIETIYEIHATDPDSDAPLFDWVAYGLSNGVMYAPFMLITREAELLRKYKPSIMAHICMTRFAKAEGFSKVDYGHYYNYKGMLKFEKEYVKGLKKQTV